jgi:hypothetical protein
VLPVGGPACDAIVRHSDVTYTIHNAVSCAAGKNPNW